MYSTDKLLSDEELIQPDFHSITKGLDQTMCIFETMCILEGIHPYANNIHLIKEAIHSFLDIPGLTYFEAMSCVAKVSETTCGHVKNCCDCFSLRYHYDGDKLFKRQNKSPWPLLDSSALEKCLGIYGEKMHSGGGDVTSTLNDEDCCPELMTL